MSLQLLVTAILVLIVSTGCTSCESVGQDHVDETYREVLFGMLPDLPVVPSFPELHWQYEDGRYWIGESDVDRLLNYVENDMTRFKWELGVYSKSFEIVMSEV